MNAGETSLDFALNLSLLFTLGIIGLAISRGTLILFMLLPASQFLGFMDPMVIAIKGLFDIHLLLAIIVILAVLVSLHHVADLRHAQFRMPMLVLALLWGYGVLYPVYQGSSSLLLSLKASKEFFSLFSYFGIFLFLRTARDIEWGWRFLMALGFYYSGVEIVSQVLGNTLLEHMSFLYRKEGAFFWKVYLSFWPVILVTFLSSYYELALGIRRPYAKLVLGSLGLALTFFRSYLLGAIGSIPLALTLAGQGMGSALSRTAVLVLILIAGVMVVAGMFTDSSTESLEHTLDTFITSGITEMQTQKGGALEGREVFAKERRKILAKSLYIGYGFIDKESKAGLLFQIQILGDTLGYIDKGDLDVALKFGYVGQVLLYGTFAYICLGLVRLAHQQLQPILRLRCLAIASLVIVFLIVQPVHAPLTYSFGLLPLGITLGLIERERLMTLGGQAHE